MKTDEQHAELVAMLKEMRASMEELKATKGEFEQWKPQMENSVGDLQMSVADLRNQVDLLLTKQDSMAKSGEEVSLAPSPVWETTAPKGTPATAHLEASSSEAAFGHNGHRSAHHHRGFGFGVFNTSIPPPVTGTMHPNSYASIPFKIGDAPSLGTMSFSSQLAAAMPQLSFPQFDGNNPKLWIKRCETFFELYEIPPHLWVKVSTMHFVGTAAFWLQSTESNLNQISWAEFCLAVSHRFERDQGNQLIRQFFHIAQTGSVVEYIEKFDEIVHQLLAHDPTISRAVITNRFIDGLKGDIKAIVLIHRPVDLDAACSLAILQEEVLQESTKKESRRSEGAPYFRSSTRSVFSGSGYLSKGQGPAVYSEEKKNWSGGSGSKSNAKDNQEDRLSALKAYRRAKGLCFKCGERWGANHKCSSTVPLNVVEEIWSLSEDGIGNLESNLNEMGEEAEDLMAISQQAIEGTEGTRTVRMQGYISQCEVIMLVDSGSSHCFISEQLASGIPGWKELETPMRVKVANGGLLLCTHELPGQTWGVQGHTFCSPFKILPLNCYDIILGMDWLEANSPMEVHWLDKWMSFKYKGNTVKLQGLKRGVQFGAPINEFQLEAMQKSDRLLHVVQVQVVNSMASSSEGLPTEVQQLIQNFSDLFQEPSGLPPKRNSDHLIPLIPGAHPFRLRPYRYSPAQKDEIEKQVKALLLNGMIQESSSPFASPVLLVKKKTGEWRMCVDYRRLNALTIKNKYPLPIIDEFLDELHGAGWFTTLDLRAGYHQIRIAQGEEFKTAFQTHNGHYEYKVMLYGLTGAPATFQSVMNSVLSDLLRKCVVMFIDDILIYSKTWQDHVKHLQLVFEILQANGLKVKLSKCCFAQQQLAYLGHVISARGVQTDPDKISIIKDWPTPSTVKEVRSFLGLVGYYRKFVRHFGHLSKPLTNLLKKGEIFVWTQTTDEAFQALKRALITALVLAMPYFSKPFMVETDASDHGIGAVLQQEGHPIAFVSKTLGPRTQGLSTYEKEYLAIILAVDHWRSYLQQGEFVIKTDHKSLMHLDEQRLSTPWQHKALTKMLGLQYKIVYKKGAENKVADALSRVSQLSNTAEVATLSVAHPIWLEEVVSGYRDDEAASKLLAELAITGQAGHYTLKGGLIRYKNRIWIANNPKLQSKIMQALHTSAIGGHSGFEVTYKRVKNLFAWPKLKQMVKTFVSSCNVCQQAKSERVAYPGLLVPLPVLEGAWQLKRAVQSPELVSADLPNLPANLQVPQVILNRRLHRQQNKAVSQILVQWSSWPASLATWENEEALRQLFPAAPAWGQAFLQGEEDVTDLQDASGLLEQEAKEASSTGDQANQEEASGFGRRERPARQRKANVRVTGPEWRK
ncbi:uncharacterized protein LOC133906051 [Phragmites australis]|uniref:uncharacterized protein LOC133906051 n=1 Tax=Phragmites australis TaxID=29695 RepID=UPI002D77DF1A|nr:uncharacterized protein LOC133906051 [Phragmites australis]